MRFKILPLLFGLAICSTSAFAASLNHVIAIVNDDIITQAELETRINHVKRQYPDAPAADLHFKEQILERLVLEKVQLQRARDTGIRVEDKAVEEAIEQIASQQNLSREALLAELAKQGVQYSHFRDEVRDQLLVSRLEQRDVGMGIVVTDQDVNRLLQSPDIAAQLPVEFRLSHILIPLSKDASADEQSASEHLAKLIISKYEAGESFSALATQYSKGRHAEAGGDLGWRSIQEVPAIFSDKIRQMHVSDIAGPVRNENGFHILLLNDRRILAEAFPVRYHLKRIGQSLDGGSDVYSALSALSGALKSGDISYEAAYEQYNTLDLQNTDHGDIGWQVHVGLPPVVADAIANLSAQEVSQPVQVGDEWHLYQVVEREEIDDVDLYLRNNARQVAYQMKWQERLESWSNALLSEAYVQVINTEADGG